MQGGRYADFVRARAGERVVAGPIVDREGHEIGRHQGIVDFTVGQRRGLGLGGGRDRSYVIGIDPATHAVQVGTRADLLSREVLLRDWNWQRARPPLPGEGFAIQVRSAGKAAGAELAAVGRELGVRLAAPILGAVAGQSGVLYEGERVAGGGVIARAQV